jgi:hypothetical protein
MAWDVYAEVAARWNARVSAAGPGREFGFSEYLAYLMNVYDRLDRLNRELGEAMMAEVLEDWPMPPGAALGVNELERLRERPWWRYLELSREVIDCFYPGIAALSPAAPGPEEGRTLGTWISYARPSGTTPGWQGR